MSDQIDTLNEIHVMQNQMNTMFKLFAPKKMSKDQQDLYNAHNEAVKSRKKNPDQPESNFGTKYLASQEKTNDYLARLIKTTDAARSIDRNPSSSSLNPINIATNIGKFLENDGNKGLTSALLKLPGGLLNFGKDLSKKKELKKLDTTRKDFNINKQIFEARTQELADMKKKHKEENPSGVENPVHLMQQQALEAKIANQKELVKTKAKKFSAETEAMQYKTDLKLDPKKYKGINATDVETLRKNQERKMEDSLLSGIDKKEKKKKNRQENIKQEVSEPQYQSKLLDQFGNLISPSTGKRNISISGGNVFGGNSSIGGTDNSLLNTKISISPATPSTFGETVGGIYYRLGILSDNKSKTNIEDKSNKKTPLVDKIPEFLRMAPTRILSKLWGNSSESGRAEGRSTDRIKDRKNKSRDNLTTSPLLNTKISISPATPSTFGETVGGIYYRLGTLIDKSNKSNNEVKPKESESLLGSILKNLGGALADVGGLVIRALTSIIPAIMPSIIAGAQVMAPFVLPAMAGALAFAAVDWVNKKLHKDDPNFVGAGEILFGDPAEKIKQNQIAAAKKTIEERRIKKSTDTKVSSMFSEGIKIENKPINQSINKTTSIEGSPQKTIEKSTNIRESISPTLQTGSEVDRTRSLSDQGKMLEDAVYRGNKRSMKEDLENNEQTRARINADATLTRGAY